MPDQNQLRDALIAIDGRGYKAYKDLRGSYQFSDFSLYKDHVQGDPFAAPSRLRVEVVQDQPATRRTPTPMPAIATPSAPTSPANSTATAGSFKQDAARAKAG